MRHLLQILLAISLMLYLDGYNGSDAQPVGTLASNDYRFINQIPELELTNNEAISQSDQNPFSGQ